MPDHVAIPQQFINVAREFRNKLYRNLCGWVTQADWTRPRGDGIFQVVVPVNTEITIPIVDMVLPLLMEYGFSGLRCEDERLTTSVRVARKDYAGLLAHYLCTQGGDYVSAVLAEIRRLRWFGTENNPLLTDQNANVHDAVRTFHGARVEGRILTMAQDMSDSIHATLVGHRTSDDWFDGDGPPFIRSGDVITEVQAHHVILELVMFENYLRICDSACRARLIDIRSNYNHTLHQYAAGHCPRTARDLCARIRTELQNVYAMQVLLPGWRGERVALALPVSIRPGEEE